jgi:hypothetical protein
MAAAAVTAATVDDGAIDTVVLPARAGAVAVHVAKAARAAVIRVARLALAAAAKQLPQVIAMTVSNRLLTEKSAASGMKLDITAKREFIRISRCLHQNIAKAEIA